MTSNFELYKLHTLVKVQLSTINNWAGPEGNILDSVGYFVSPDTTGTSHSCNVILFEILLVETEIAINQIESCER